MTTASKTVTHNGRTVILKASKNARKRWGVVLYNVNMDIIGDIFLYCNSNWSKVKNKNAETALEFFNNNYELDNCIR